jgi:hypothetical protein
VEFLGGVQEDMLLLKEDGAAAGAEAMEVEGDNKTKEPKVIVLSRMSCVTECLGFFMGSS